MNNAKTGCAINGAARLSFNYLYHIRLKEALFKGDINDLIAKRNIIHAHCRSLLWEK